MVENLSEQFKSILITGGAGFIGSNCIRRLIKETNAQIFNLDKVSYSSDISTINEFINDKKSKYKFLKVDLCDEKATRDAINYSKPNLIINFAAESHVDRSINNPRQFLNSNTIGTFNLLESARNYWEKINLSEKNIFKFIHVSTDEVFGSLREQGQFSEESQYSPSSPYSASKAASDHFAKAWFKTYNLPTIVSNCSNNYGPRQFPEKLIPLTLQKIITNKAIPIYGDGSNVRDWLFVDDHIDALIKIASEGEPGSNYCIGGGQEISNLNLINLICEKMNKALNLKNESKRLIKFVKDRPGHDYRYSINNNLIKRELDWSPNTGFDKGLDLTIKWYLNNQDWSQRIIRDSKYNLDRLGL